MSMPRLAQALLSFLLLVQIQVLHAAIVPVAPGTGTLAAAIAGASAGDVLELANGTYNEGAVPINKQLEIRAATGANPLVDITTANITPGSGTFLFDITAAGVIWDGIDVNLNGNDPQAPNTIRAFYVRGAGSTSTNPVVIQNCTITDGPNGPVTGYWVVGVETTNYLILNDVTVIIDETTPQVGLSAFVEPAVLELNRCDVRVRSQDSCLYTQSSAEGTTPSTIIARDTRIAGAGAGVPFLLTSIYSGDFQLEDCTVVLDDKVSQRGVLMRLSSNTGHFRADRTLFNTSNVTNGVSSFAGESAAYSIELTNSIVQFSSKKAPSTPFSFEAGGFLSLKHCTLVDTDALTVGSRGIVFSARNLGGAPGRLEVKNTLFNLPGTPAAYIYDQSDFSGVDNSNIVYDIGTNAILGTTSNVQAPGADAISLGTPIASNGTALLDSDNIHTLFGTVAIDAAPDIGVAIDYFGTARPQEAGFDIGAVEVIAPSAAVHWSLY